MLCYGAVGLSDAVNGAECRSFPTHQEREMPYFMPRADFICIISVAHLAPKKCIKKRNYAEKKEMEWLCNGGGTFAMKSYAFDLAVGRVYMREQH